MEPARHRIVPVARAALAAALASALVVVLCGPAPLRADEPGAGGTPKHPPTRREDVVLEMHGKKIPDPYRWLEDDDSPEVAAWDEAQHAVLRARLDAHPKRAEIAARIAAELGLEGIPSLPSFEGGRRWYEFRPKGANHAVLLSKGEDGKGEAVAVLDPNAWAADGTEGLTGWFPSPDGKWLAYLRDSKGSEEATLYLRDLATGKDVSTTHPATGAEVPFRLTRMKFASVVWSRDSKGFLYTRYPDPESVPPGEEQYRRWVRFHPLDGLVLDDEEVYGRGRPKIEDAWLAESTDRAHVFLQRGTPYRNHDTFQVVVAEGEETPDGKRVLEPVLVGQDSITYVDRAGDLFLLNTDWKAPRRRLCVAKRGETNDESKWKTILPQGAGVIQTAVIVGDAVLVLLQEDVVSRLRVIGLDGTDRGEVPLPGLGTVEESISVKPGDTRAWFRFESYDRPATNYVVDLASADRKPQALETAPTTVDVSRLVTDRFDYASKDGTKIPLFVLHRKDVALDGSAPTTLYGYGGFRVGLFPGYSMSAGLWAERGGVAAIACLRGGIEFGEEWHQAGCLENKQNVFDDFIAGADWLVSTGKAKRERLAIRGGSNGGLLVAVCANQRPDLCRAVVCEVPLTDMLRYHRWQYALEWAEEYGNPDDEKAFGWIFPYSPYHNVKPGTAYPAAFVTAGLEDGRVNAFHARKIVAQWQAATSSDRPVLLRLDRSSGHGAASLLQAQQEMVDRFCFLLEQLSAP